MTVFGAFLAGMFVGAFFGAMGLALVAVAAGGDE